MAMFGLALAMLGRRLPEAAKFRRNTALGIGLLRLLVRARSPITAVTASTIATTPILTSSFLFPILTSSFYSRPSLRSTFNIE